VSSAIIDKEVDFMVLITHFRSERGHALDILYRHCVITLCHLGAYLFVRVSSGRGLSRLLMVVDDIRYGNTTVPLMLAEIILCLDCLYHHFDQSFPEAPYCFK